MGPDNEHGYAWWQVEPYKKLYAMESTIFPPPEDNRYVRFKPLTLEHVGPQPKTFDSQKNLKKFLRENDMYSKVFSD